MNSKTTLSQVLSLILVSCLILFGCKSKNGSGASDSTNASDKAKLMARAKLKIAIAPQLFSERTDPIVAQGYQANNDLVTYNGIKDVPLERFVFNASDIDKLLNKNPDLTDPPDKLVLKFGMVITRGKKIYHLIAYGMKDSVLLDQVPNALIFDGAVNDDPITNSIPITYQTADGLKKTYLKHNLTTFDYCGNNKFVLEGFSFDIWQIQEILTRNHSGQIPDKVAFYLGLEDPEGWDRYHIIAYGIKGNTRLDTSTKTITTVASVSNGTVKAGSLVTTAARASVFDKADPCPPCKTP
jgi:hypothetical protein